MELDSATDEELIEASRQAAAGSDPVAAAAALERLFTRYRPKVAAWCQRFCGDREEGADLTQEVLLRVHERMGSFRGESRFSTWLYTVTRRVAINRGQARKLRRAESLETVPVEPDDPTVDVEAEAGRAQLVAAFRAAMARDLEPLEAKVLYLHYVDGMTLPAITELLALRNASGAKAYIVAGRRKLERRFGAWLEREGGLW
jgi:RNA polymerase sigma-70 factor (ECF subfamily)